MITSESKLTRRHDKAIVDLLSEDTVREAAKRARVGHSTLQRWLRDPMFVARLQRERAELFNAAKTQLLAASAEGRGRLCLRHPQPIASLPPRHRLQAGTTGPDGQPVANTGARYRWKMKLAPL
jgi:hypothetical protein